MEFLVLSHRITHCSPVPFCDKGMRLSALSSEGSSVYLMNCTSDPMTCSRNSLRGFPNLSAFRGLEWPKFSRCLTSQSAKLKFTKLDYHGVLLVCVCLPYSFITFEIVPFHMCCQETLYRVFTSVESTSRRFINKSR